MSLQNIKNNITRLFKKGNVNEITKKDILLLDKIIKSSERSVKKIREKNKNLKQAPFWE